MTTADGHGASIIDAADRILVTGASGFIGSRFVENLLDRGFRQVRCLVRPASDRSALEALARRNGGRAHLDVKTGNLVSREDCRAAMEGATVVFHLATGRDGKSYPDAFLNSVVTTRNLLEAARDARSVRRFVNVSSLAVYSNVEKPGGRVLDERAEVERHPERRGDPYCFAKVRQDELVAECGQRWGIPWVGLRPGYVLGPGKAAISSRVGIDTFGVFLHLGGRNRVPFTYVDNCADAIALAGIVPGVEGEVFNVVDDDLPSSRQFLRAYKRRVRPFRSVYVPHMASYVLCALWERYAAWSEGQLPPVFNRKHWRAYWKSTHYSNEKLKTRLGWRPRVAMADALNRYFGSTGAREQHA